jgi:hypothetical protein
VGADLSASQSGVPFVEVVYDSTITEPTLTQLAELIKAGLSKALPGIKYLGVWLVLVDGWWTHT